MAGQKNRGIGKRDTPAVFIKVLSLFPPAAELQALRPTRWPFLPGRSGPYSAADLLWQLPAFPCSPR